VAEEVLAEEEDESCNHVLAVKAENDRRVKLTLSELPVHLPSEKMEVVARLRYISNLHVAVLVLTIELVRRRENARIFVAQLEVALHAARRVLRALTVVTVGQ
jgi:hypothetical protein